MDFGMTSGVRLDQTIRNGPTVVRNHSNVSPAGKEWSVTETFDASSGTSASVYNNCGPIPGRPGGYRIEAYTPAETVALKHVAQALVSGAPALLVGCLSGPTGLMAVKEVAFLTHNWVRELNLSGVSDPAEVTEQLKQAQPEAGEWIVATNVDKSSPASRQALVDYTRENPDAKVFATVDRKVDTPTPHKLPALDGFQTHVITPSALNNELDGPKK